MKQILILNGHPDPESLNTAFALAYARGAGESGANVELIHLGELNFNPNLRYGYRSRTELEPELLATWDKILAADHLVWIHPLWWGGFPAIMKGFIDRLFLPGMAFAYNEKSVWWERKLKGKSARIITTMDQPVWYYRWIKRNSGVVQLKSAILHYCGVRPVKVIAIGGVKRSGPEKRKQWLDKIYQLGKKLG